MRFPGAAGRVADPDPMSYLDGNPPADPSAERNEHEVRVRSTDSEPE